jgi:hypothetical protein
MLFIADAIIRGSGKRDSKLAAIFDFMEESARTNPTRGIDTVEFVSAVKHGISGVVDISSDTLDYQETMDILKSNFPISFLSTPFCHPIIPLQAY